MKLEKVYTALAIYSGEYGAACVEFNEVFRSRKKAIDFVKQSIVRECEFGSDCKVNWPLANSLLNNLDIHNECFYDFGDGNRWHWWVNWTHIPASSSRKMAKAAVKAKPKSKKRKAKR